MRLKGGDGFIFGRGGEEIDALEAAGVAWHVVPGVTAATGAGAALNMALTHRDYSQALTLITAQRRKGGFDIDCARHAAPANRGVLHGFVLTRRHFAAGDAERRPLRSCPRRPSPINC